MSAFVRAAAHSGATVTALPPPSWPSSSRTACCAALNAGCGGSARSGRCPSSPDPRRRLLRRNAASCSISIRSAISPASCCAARRAQASPRCRSAASISRTTRRRLHRDEARQGPRGRGRRAAVARTAGAARARGPLARDAEGFVSTGLARRGRARATATACGSGATPSSCIMAASPSPPRARSALSELPGLSRRRLLRAAGPHRRRPHFRGDRAEAQASRSRSRRCTGFSSSGSVAPYKLPDRLVVVKQIPRDADGRVQREQMLQQV